MLRQTGRVNGPAINRITVSLTEEERKKERESVTIHLFSRESEEGGAKVSSRSVSFRIFKPYIVLSKQKETWSRNVPLRKVVKKLM